MSEEDPKVPGSVVVETKKKDGTPVKITLIQTGKISGNIGTNMKPIKEETGEKKSK